MRAQVLEGQQPHHSSSSSALALPVANTFDAIAEGIAAARKAKLLTDKERVLEQRTYDTALARHTGESDVSTAALRTVAGTCASGVADTISWEHRPPLSSTVQSACWRPRTARELAQLVAGLDTSSNPICKRLASMLERDWDVRHMT
eukprot:4732191-Pyramimonas_sp.AAC.1